MTVEAFPDALPVGYRLHWYVIEHVLGQGGFGITHLARDTNLDRRVAIKEFLPTDFARRRSDGTVHPHTDSNTERYAWGLDRFLSEARTLARFDHPNIVRVVSVFEANNTAYMVMRFEEGESLKSLLQRQGTLPERQVLDCVLPILLGLEQVHAAGFIHRDIKPENIYVRRDGSPVLLDFGSARQSFGRAKTITILVAPGYAPLEQYYGDPQTQGPWTDIYSLGATCYRAITGHAPMDAVARAKGVLGSAREILQPAAELGRGRYSDGLLAAVDHALQLSERDRPQSIAEWRSEIMGAANTWAAAAPPPAVPPGPVAARVPGLDPWASQSSVTTSSPPQPALPSPPPPSPTTAPVAAVPAPAPVSAPPVTGSRHRAALVWGSAAMATSAAIAVGAGLLVQNRRGEGTPPSEPKSTTTAPATPPQLTLAPETKATLSALANPPDPTAPPAAPPAMAAAPSPPATPGGGADKAGKEAGSSRSPKPEPAPSPAAAPAKLPPTRDAAPALAPAVAIAAPATPPLPAPAAPPAPAPSLVAIAPAPAPAPAPASPVAPREPSLQEVQLAAAESAILRGDAQGAEALLARWANAGVPRAHLLLGRAKEASGSYMLAYVRYSLAASGGEADASALRDRVANRLQPAERKQAERMVERFQPGTDTNTRATP